MQKKEVRIVRSYIIAILLCIAIIAASIALYSWMYQAVMSTDWPDWFKYMLLR